MGEKIKLHTIAFLVNPVAGMGGSVGLKGTDGLADRARKLGAKEIAPVRAKAALTRFFHLLDTEKDMAVRLLTPSFPMGGDVCRKSMSEVMEKTSTDLTHVILEEIYAPTIPTDAEDTMKFCKMAMENNADIILFAGGDGTARDIVRVVGEDIPVLGIPCGVKMHSGVFAYTPEDAGEVVFDYLKGRASLEGREVVDLDEEAYRQGKIRTNLYGLARVALTNRVQGCKNILNSPEDIEDRRSIAMELRDFMAYNPGIYLMGAGSTIRDIGIELGVELTPLGFDAVVCNKKYAQGCIVIEKDINEQAILRLLKKFPRERRYLIVTPIGAQGFILGRGTQVISERVLKELDRKNIIVVATPGKMEVTPVLRVDTGIFNDIIRGYIKVIVGYRRSVLRKLE